MSIDQLQSAVTQLPPKELELFVRWLEEYRADLWDQQIEADILAGRLDEAVQRAEADFEAGHCTPLP